MNEKRRYTLAAIVQILLYILSSFCKYILWASLTVCKYISYRKHSCKSHFKTRKDRKRTANGSSSRPAGACFRPRQSSSYHLGPAYQLVPAPKVTVCVVKTKWRYLFDLRQRPLYINNVWQIMTNPYTWQPLFQNVWVRDGCITKPSNPKERKKHTQNKENVIRSHTSVIVSGTALPGLPGLHWPSVRQLPSCAWPRSECNLSRGAGSMTYHAYHGYPFLPLKSVHDRKGEHKEKLQKGVYATWSLQTDRESWT